MKESNSKRGSRQLIISHNKKTAMDPFVQPTEVGFSTSVNLIRKIPYVHTQKLT